ncbi:cyclin-like protein [Stachybotrys elegans]|uniref:Cyclin-like protein n=1 Tax=Stachybotrys elegans TaxID=80388 RepID=A0A8K0SQF9_9HYPO|nr:cyclin-like protein [Stachybotrys elegans]
MASNAATGFRGPAKRSAFGDVTNLSKNIGIARDDGKIVKVQAVMPTTAEIRPYGSKDSSAPARDAFARPAQRVPALANKPKSTIEPYMGDEIKKPVRNAIIDPINAAQEAEIVSKHKAPSRHQGVLETAPLQPRHHKSQPHLKAQQPSLRKTQSRYMENFSVARDRVEIPAATDNASIINTHSYEQFANSAAYVEPACPVPVSDSRAELNQEVEIAQLPQKLTTVSEEVALPATEKDATGHAMSEPEEYWEEEEEDYDDQDQAYTTAHSFRSRDLTTGGATTLLAPRVTARVQRELEEARLVVEKSITPEELDDEAWDVSMVAEYGEEIFEYMRELEIKMLPNAHYMDNQTEIQWSMRSVLMDWLVQVHGRFGLLPETLFLTVNYIDRFLSNKIVSIGKLQLVGATAILLASKYEEINCPSLYDITYMVDWGYSKEEILKAERFMLSMLGFELGWPGPMSFLRRVSKADDYDLETRTLAKYFLELTIMDERFVASPPSYLAAGAHCLSRFILKKGDWTKAHVHYSGYTWGQLKPLVSIMIECCEHPTVHHGAIFEKYSKDRFKEASTLVQRALDAGFTLPHHAMPVRSIEPQPLRFEDHLESLQSSNGVLVPTEG